MPDSVSRGLGERSTGTSRIGSNAIRPKKLRKKAISHVGSVAEARRMQIAIMPKLSVLASIRPAACACTLRGLLTSAPR